MYIARFRNLRDGIRTSSAAMGFRAAPAVASIPACARQPGFGVAFKRAVRRKYPTRFGIIAFGEVLPRYENVVDVDPAVVDGWGLPAAALQLPSSATTS